MSKDFDPNYKQVSVNFRVGQKVVIFNHQNQILFLRRSDKTERAGGWDFPGGGLENEEPDEGIKRETREEASIEITSIRPVGFITHDREEPNFRTLIIGYVARWLSGEVQLSWEHDEYHWLSVEEALRIDLPQGHRKFLDLAIAELNNLP